MLETHLRYLRVSYLYLSAIALCNKSEYRISSTGFKVTFMILVCFLIYSFKTLEIVKRNASKQKYRTMVIPLFVTL